MHVVCALDGSTVDYTVKWFTIFINDNLYELYLT